MVTIYYVVVALIVSMNPLVFTFGVLAMGLLYSSEGFNRYSQVSTLALLSVIVAISFTVATISFRWCFPKQRGAVVGMLAGMFCLSVLLSSPELLSALLQPRDNHSLASTIVALGRVAVSTLGVCLVLALLSVLLLEIPITWFCSWCWNRQISREGCAEVRWIALLWFVIQGWPLFDDFLRGRYLSLLEALAGTS